MDKATLNNNFYRIEEILEIILMNETILSNNCY